MEKISNFAAHKLTAPFPYVLITTLDVNNEVNAMGLSWVTRTSWNPYLMSISVAHSRYTWKCLQHHPEYVINYPTAEQIKAAWFCGKHSGRNGNKLKKAGLETIESLEVDVPTIQDIAVAIECKVVSDFETGDHTVFIGKVVATRKSTKDVKHLYFKGKDKLFTVDI